MTIYQNATIDPTNIAPVLTSFEGSMRFVTTGRPAFIYTLTPEDRELGMIPALYLVLQKMSPLIR